MPREQRFGDAEDAFPSGKIRLHGVQGRLVRNQTIV
jgi:hypothetical protein